MLEKSSISLCFLFAIFYPLCFWISVRDPLKNNFHRFHVGLPSFIAGVTAASMFPLELPLFFKIATVVWAVSLLVMADHQWDKPHANPLIVSLPSLLGLCAFYNFLMVSQPVDLVQFIIILLGGAIFSISIYALNLGHWYLNVHGLSMQHLINTVQVFTVLLGVRLIYDLILISVMMISVDGEPIRLISFLTSSNGVFLLIALFFGTLFPGLSLNFVHGTLLVKNTQSATGILYAILCSVIIGEITYMHFWLKFGIVL
jgi:hypothetical protein